METAKAEAFDFKTLMSLKGASIAATSAVVLASAGALSLSNSIADSDTIVKGVRAEGKDISGMTTAEAQQYLQTLGDEKVKPLTFTYGEQTFTINPADINFKANVDEATRQAHSFGRGGDWSHNIQSQIRCALNGRNVTLTAGYDAELLNARLNDIAAQINQQPSNAYCYLNPDGSIGKVNGEIGYRLDTEKVAQSLKTPLETLNVPDSIALEPKEVLPFVTTEDIAAIDSILGEYSTSYYPGARGDNIALAASYLNDRIVKVGWEFSFNDTVGERTYAAGYQTAGVGQRLQSCGRDNQRARRAGCRRRRLSSELDALQRRPVGGLDADGSDGAFLPLDLRCARARCHRCRRSDRFQIPQRSPAQRLSAVERMGFDRDRLRARHPSRSQRRKD